MPRGKKIPSSAAKRLDSHSDAHFQSDNFQLDLLTALGQPVLIDTQTGEVLMNPEPDQAQLNASAAARQAFSVSQLTAYLQALLDEDPVLGRSLTVRGEFSNVKQSSRGHLYYTLKDENAALNGVMWAGLLKTLPFEPENGLEVFVTGHLELYAPNGTYSIVASHIEPVGMGALQLAYEQLKQKLEAEGLFLSEHKRPVPVFPERLAIITSKTGAVIHDMLRVLWRKNPLVHVLLVPVKVQGEGAAQQIAEAIEQLNDLIPAQRPDVMIVARGGGSFEDLFCFSQEPVVRAIFASVIPVITGIGHEPDYGLADAAADYSAATPTAAADYAVPDIEQLKLLFTRVQTDLQQALLRVLNQGEQQLDLLTERLLNTASRWPEQWQSRLSQLQESLIQRIQQHQSLAENRLSQSAAELEAVSPLAVLSRGYAVVSTAQGNVLKSAQHVQPDDLLLIRLLDGQVCAQVTEVTAISEGEESP